MEIYLASASPRRRELLDQIGVSFSILSVDVDESPLAGEAPEIYVERLARLKASTAQSQLNTALPAVFIGADTSVVVDGQILGKPANREDAFMMLSRLSGRTHQVMTGVAVAVAEQLQSIVSTSQVSFRPVSEAEMLAYWNTGECSDKAGAYAIQGKAALFISHLQGSYSSVMGLPIYETGILLKQAGIELLGPAVVEKN